MSETGLTRRATLRASGIALVGVVAGYAVARNSAAARTKRGTTAANAYGPSTKQGGKVLVPLDKVPRNGGVVLSDPSVVITRGAGDEVHAFSAVCTHQGCTVDRVAAGRIHCPCHGSVFDAASGAVVKGPATRPLPAVEVTVRQGSVYAS